MSDSVLHPGYFSAPLGESDPAVADMVAREGQRQRQVIELIASENIVSRAVLEAQGSLLTNKTVEGYPGRRYGLSGRCAREILRVISGAAARGESRRRNAPVRLRRYA